MEHLNVKALSKLQLVSVALDLFWYLICNSLSTQTQPLPPPPACALMWVISEPHRPCPPPPSQPLRVSTFWCSLCALPNIIFNKESLSFRFLAEWEEWPLVFIWWGGGAVVVAGRQIWLIDIKPKCLLCAFWEDWVEATYMGSCIRWQSFTSLFCLVIRMSSLAVPWTSQFGSKHSSLHTSSSINQ